MYIVRVYNKLLTIYFVLSRRLEFEPAFVTAALSVSGTLDVDSMLKNAHLCTISPWCNRRM